jgi:hypothetical protein
MLVVYRQPALVQSHAFPRQISHTRVDWPVFAKFPAQKRVKIILVKAPDLNWRGFAVNLPIS